jgi:hypothetical protein
MKPNFTLNTVCFYWKMFIVAGLLCFLIYYSTNDIKTTTMTTIKLTCEHKLVMASVRQEISEAVQMVQMSKIHVS